MIEELQTYVDRKYQFRIDEVRIHALTELKIIKENLIRRMKKELDNSLIKQVDKMISTENQKEQKFYNLYRDDEFDKGILSEKMTLIKTKRNQLQSELNILTKTFEEYVKDIGRIDRTIEELDGLFQERLYL